MELTLRRHNPTDPALADVLDLIRSSFAYMDGVIDPPSSIHRLTLDALRTQADLGEVWSIGPPLCACAVFTLQPDALYVGKLAVAPHSRGQGLARRLLDHAAGRAQSHGRETVELQTRVELTANHAVFTGLGFRETGRTSHPGFNRPTSITFRRHVPLTAP